jgi:uncharacterized protein YecT (DUF1311 family)
MNRLLFGVAFFVASASGVMAAGPTLYPTKDCGKEMAQMGLNQCTGDNLAAANAALGKIYGKMLALESGPKDKETFRDVERAWVAYKDKQCQWETAGDQGGSIWAMEYNQCEIEKTDARIRELMRSAGCTGSAASCNPQ